MPRWPYLARRFAEVKCAVRTDRSRAPRWSRRLRCLGGKHDREVDLGVSNDVDEVREYVLSHDCDDFDDLGVADTRQL